MKLLCCCFLIRGQIVEILESSACRSDSFDLMEKKKDDMLLLEFPGFYGDSFSSD